MADFKLAYAIVRRNEGGYVNDPEDVGGETYKGIARKYHPYWPGWVSIDNLRSDSNFPKCLENLPNLQSRVHEFFSVLYWDPILGSDIPNQQIANEMFDTAVNMGITRAVKFLQAGLNLLNRNERVYFDIVEDGQIGPATLKALQKYLKPDQPHFLLKIMVILRGMHYINYMRKSPTQERFARGWLNRLHL